MSNEELVKLIQEGADVSGNMGLLYQNNKGLIYRIAKRYYELAEMDDLAQEGYFGLYTAALKYDASQEVLFATYAGHWIRQYMTRFLEDDGLIRRPSHQFQRINQYKQLQGKFMAAYGRQPTEQEIAYYLELSNKQAKQLVKDISSYRVESLEHPIAGEDEDILLGDSIASDCDTEVQVIDSVSAAELKHDLWNVVDTLPDNEAKAIRYRFENNMSLQAVGDALGVSRSFARTCEAAGLRKLRGKSKIKEIGRDYGYISSSAYRYGVDRFRHTWTSSTEYEVLRRLRLLTKDDGAPCKE